jgi:hypothetical protein
MATAGTSTATFVGTKDQTQDTTIAIQIERTQTETSALTATEQVAAYFFEDLKDFVQQTRINLEQAVCDTQEFPDAPEMFLTLLCADIERLLREGFITGMTLILSDQPDADGKYLVRYRAVYYVRKETGNTNIPRLVERTGGRLSPPKHAAAGAHVALLVDWVPSKDPRREIRQPIYHFNWVPKQRAVFNEDLLAPQYRVGQMRPAGGELYVTRFEEARPEYLRGRRMDDIR